MSVHPIDSRVFGPDWASDELRPLFEDDGRTRGWCEVLAVLAEEEAALGIIPADAAPEIARALRGEPVDLEEVRRTTAETHHSLLGLIRVLAARCRSGAGEWICYGATVQDVSDTWYALTLLKVADVAERDLAGLEADLATLARAHRSTPMLGRTHGQAGLPITFGYKAAVWVDEIRRHRARLAELRPRLGVGQLAGAVGTLSGYGPRGLELQARVMARLGLGVPDISWTSARDRFAEFVVWLAFVTALLDRIGQEVYNLQRSEIGELAEPAGGRRRRQHHDAPQAQPRAERAPRDARPPRPRSRRVSCSRRWSGTTSATAGAGSWSGRRSPSRASRPAPPSLLARELVAGLEVRADAMLRNLDEWHEEAAAESIMLALAPLTGKQTAHERVHAVVARARVAGRSLRDELRDDPEIGGRLPGGGDRSAARRPVDRTRRGARRSRRGPVSQRPLPVELPRFRLASLPTPLHDAPRLARAIGVDRLLVKRDDLTGFAGGGNKVRKLKFLVGDALATGADTLIATGGPQSNAVRTAMVAARVAGLDPIAVLYGAPPPGREGNLLLDVLAGARLVFTGDPDRAATEAAAEQLAVELRAAGRRPYVLPRGAATPVGDAGYVEAAAELAAQLEEIDVQPGGGRRGERVRRDPGRPDRRHGVAGRFVPHHRDPRQPATAGGRSPAPGARPIHGRAAAAGDGDRPPGHPRRGGRAGSRLRGRIAGRRGRPAPGADDRGAHPRPGLHRAGAGRFDTPRGAWYFRSSRAPGVRAYRRRACALCPARPGDERNGRGHVPAGPSHVPAGPSHVPASFMHV